MPPEADSLREEQSYATENPNSSAKVPRLNTDSKGLGREFSGQPWGEGKLIYLGLACTLASRTRPPFPPFLPKLPPLRVVQR